nr:aspartate aminotransferase family protein [uncultured Anaeromusa sp.]
MDNSQGLTREGDVNSGRLREQWLVGLNAESIKALQEDEAVFMRQSMSTPCLQSLVRADGCYIYDQDGKRYLDFHGNSLHQVGYRNPDVLSAVTEQLGTLPFIPRRYTADIAVRAAKALIEATTSKDFKVLFTPSGTAAVGLALKIARKVTGKHKVISLWEAFHGASLDCISVGGEYVFTKELGPLLPGCIKAIPYNAYRNLLHSSCPERVADFCLDYLEYIFQNEGDIGAVLLEPIRATDIHVPPRSYFQRLKQMCEHYQALLIFDEIPTALGRSGEFYVHQNFGVEPDLLVLGKGLGGGVVPQAAVLIKKCYDQCSDVSLGHYTHEKPAAGCAAICAAVGYIKEHQLLENCRHQSVFAKQAAAILSERYVCIGDVRICGLLISFELVKDRTTKEKDSVLAEKILYYCLEKGLSFKLAAGNCITWHPPLIVTEEQLSSAFQIFEEAIKDCACERVG